MASPTELEFFTNLVKIYGPSTKEHDAVAFMTQEMEKMGFYDVHIDDVGNAVGSIGHGEEILMLGHIDTVPGNIPVEQKGDLLYGRGTVDAKGPLAAFTLAAARMGSDFQKKITVVGAVEEEIHTSKGANGRIGKHDPIAVIIGEPSGVNRVTLGYKGCLRAHYTVSVDIGHPAGKLNNANEVAISYWNTMKQYVENYNISKSLFSSIDLTLKEITTSTNDFQDTVFLDLYYRIPIGCDVELLKQLIITQKGNGEVTFFDQEIPYKENKNNFLPRTFISAIRAQELTPKYVTKTGTADMNVLAPHYPNVPFVAYGPGDSSLDHTPNEHISLREFGKSIDVLEHVLRLLEKREK